MAAIDLSAKAVAWFTRRFSVGTVANQLQEVILPAWVDVVRITAETNDVKVTHEGADAAAIGTDYLVCFGDSTLPIFKPRLKMSTSEERQISSEPWSIFITAAVATNVSVDPIEEY